ncbi:hypothetical protein T09_13922 [Trichinella sp. T9]|nr:hypothetical protein T09_13922 [Trichinella sp. T9]
MVAQSPLLCGFAWSEQRRCQLDFNLKPFQHLTTRVVAEKQEIQLALRHRCFRTRSNVFITASFR